MAAKANPQPTPVQQFADDYGFRIPATPETMNQLEPRHMLPFYLHRFRVEHILPSELAARCLINRQGGPHVSKKPPKPVRGPSGRKPQQRF